MQLRFSAAVKQHLIFLAAVRRSHKIDRWRKISAGFGYVGGGDCRLMPICARDDAGHRGRHHCRQRRRRRDYTRAARVRTRARARRGRDFAGRLWRCVECVAADLMLDEGGGVRSAARFILRC